jgi:endonuclease G
MGFYLSQAQVYQLADAILAGGLNTPDAREDLLSNIHRGYVAMLATRSNPFDQLKSDLNAMNEVSYLDGNEVPLQIWLENAVHRLRRAGRPQQKVFQQMLNEVATKSQAAIAAEGAAIETAKAPAGQLERIIHEDDLLNFGWLQGAVAVGASVARLVVTRYENGAPYVSPNTGQPVRTAGTGWLIGPQHLITNHHVINGRSESEPLAEEGDLRLQVQSMVVQFDYDFNNAAGTPAAVESLEAWDNWNATPALDYAIVKLAAPSPRTPITLAPSALAEFKEQIRPVNIIQHPNGNPKSLGVRNNLTTLPLEEYELRYFTDTMRGSSGSPVCNDVWQAVALHRAQYRLTTSIDFQGKSTAWVNRGVRIDRIIDHLKTKHAALWSAIGATVV